MSKHTPGPWVAVRWSDDEVDAYGWSFSAGGHLLPLSDLETDNPDECDANARLIAAAPDLLDALRIAREIVVTERDAAHQGVVNPSTGVIDDHDDADWVAGYDRAMEQIDAAIEKATGEKA